MRVSKIKLLCCTLFFVLGAAPVPVVKIGVKDPLPVPSQLEQVSAEKRIREVYSAEFSKSSPADKSALANRLHSVALESRDDPAAQYALLAQSINLALAGNDIPLAMQSLDRLKSTFAINAPATADLLIAQLRPGSPADAVAAAQACFLALEWSVQTENAPLAEKFIQQARTFADKSLDPKIIALAKSRETMAKSSFLLLNDAASARKTLADSPDDPAASAILGQTLCLVKNQFSQGLPHLACSDSPLAGAARTDLANPAKPQEQFELANAWWTLAQSPDALVQYPLQQRAAHWYLKSARGLEGLNRETALKRTADSVASLAGALGLSPGLSTRIFSTEDFQKPLKSRITQSLDYDNAANPDLDLPKSNYSIRYAGFILLPAAGQYEFTLIANDGARFIMGDQKIIDDPNLGQKRNGAKFTADANLLKIPVQLEYWNASGVGRCRLLWKSPLTGKEEPFPFLFH